MSVSSATQIQEKPAPFREEFLVYLRTADGVRKIVFDLFSTIADAILLLRPHHKLDALSTSFKQAKNFTVIAKIPDELAKTAEQTQKACQEKTASSTFQILNRVSALLVPMTDAVDAIRQRIYPLSARSILALGVVGNAALVISSLFDASDSAKKVQEVADPILNGQALMSGLSAASDVVFGGLGVLNCTGTVLIAPWIFLALSASSLFFTLTGRFYQQIK